MYFEIDVGQNDQDFSWILAKNPASPPFEREVGAGGKRSVKAAFVGDCYQVVVHNDVLKMLKEMRRRNMQAYVRPEPFVVCPANLRGVGIALRSALHGQPGAMDPERFWAPKTVRMVCGPVARENVWLGVFEGMGLHARWVEPEEAALVGSLELVTAQPMSVTDALSRAYLGLHAISTRYDWDDHPEGARVDRFLALAARWLGAIDTDARNFLTRRLSGYSKALIRKFERAAAGEPEEDEPAPAADVQVKQSLHQRRHEIIANCLAAHPWGDKLSVVDLGAGEGRLVEDLVKRLAAWRGDRWRLFGMDAQRTRVARLRRRLKSTEGADHVQILHGNVLWPRNLDELAGAQVVILSEVIEHLAKQDRAELLRIIREVIEPEMILLTTPNVAYNPVLGLEPGVLRHSDHKVEYDRAGLGLEVLDALTADYDTSLLTMDPELPEQPSFIVQAIRRSGVKRSEHRGRIRARVQRMNESSYFPETGAFVGPKEMLDGYTSHTFLGNAPDIFYLGPNIAPVDYVGDTEHTRDFLEHPEGAFRYYRDRGVRWIVEEPKYMGSRAYVLAFREPEMAGALGKRGPVIVNSRSGARFFPGPADASSAEEIAIWEDLRPGMESCGLDFVILDAEVLPWGLKARDLIRREFELPGHAALAWRLRFGTPDSVRHARMYLEALSQYSGDGPTQVRAFHLLAYGQVKMAPRPRMLADGLGMMANHDEQMSLVGRLAGKLVSAADCQLVDLESDDDTASSIERWHRDTQERGLEGAVYKPRLMCPHAPSGYPIQPALKVRGREYLRIIYGMDYTQSELFRELRQRGTKAKRMLAVQQQEIANAILRAFVHRNDPERLRAAAAFLGLEEAWRGVIDRTL
jgi:2-polyprenyl-3-methyl-5-hydroxy-6-metoxy-1,4-benzoquinol methylase